MSPNTLRTRGLRFAFLFGPPRLITREEGTSFYAAVSDALGIDDFTYTYRSPESPDPRAPRPVSVELARKEGRGALGIKIDNPGLQSPIRLLIAYEWPPSGEHVRQVFDEVAQATFSSLPGDWERVVAEVRILAECTAAGSSGLEYLRQRLDWLNSLGEPMHFIGIKVEIEASAPTPNGDTLSGSRRELSIELARDDPRNLYLELMSMWPKVSMTGGQLMLTPSAMRPIDQEPSSYVEDAENFLREKIRQLARGEA